MFTLSRTISLLAICALAVASVAPVAASASNHSPAGENYVLEVPDAGNGGAKGGQGSQDGSGDGAGVPAAAADGADEGGLPILILVLVGTAAVGAAIAILRRKTTT